MNRAVLSASAPIPDIGYVRRFVGDGPLADIGRSLDQLVGAGDHAYSGTPAFRNPSINSFAFDCPPRAIHADIVKAGSTSSRRAAASRASASRPRRAKADARQR